MTAVPQIRAAHFDTEAQVQAAVEQYFSDLLLPHAAQFQTGRGPADLALYSGSTPWGLIELKLGLAVDEFQLADAADYFEQCLKYRKATGLPVFLGPFFVPTGGTSHFFTGGSRSRTTASFSALAGRCDIGLFFIESPVGGETDPAQWRGFQLTLRQKRIAAYQDPPGWVTPLWPQAAPPMVDHDNSSASKKVRK